MTSASASASANTTAAATATGQPSAKREGDISDSFASLAGVHAEPLPDKFRQLKLSLVDGHEAQIFDSWKRLLAALKTENAVIARQGPGIIPDVRFSHLAEDLARLRPELKKRGVAVVRGVVPPQEARGYKDEVEAYVRKNPGTKGFPAENPQVFELYWSEPQLRARSHPNMLRVQRELLKLWHVADDDAALVDLSQPLTYADRLRIRQPGDARFALGPHQDGGSVKRWETDGYGKGHVYDAVFAGQWEAYDPWDAGRRSDAVCDLYGGLGACSAFRAFQGWLSMSSVRPQEGTLLVCPLAQLATAYTLLRPFFRPVQQLAPPAAAGAKAADPWLSPDNWVFTAGDQMTSELQGATPGHGQEFSTTMHPHLELDKTMVHVPEVQPGDFVVWHCDTIHAVDPLHRGTSDSSVLYIPVCPTNETNARYLARQRESFLQGTPAPDFPGGKGESGHVGRPTADCIATSEGLRAMGLAGLHTEGLHGGAEVIVKRANLLLGH